MNPSSRRSRRARFPSLLLGLCCLLLASSATVADAAEMMFGPHDIETLFYIAKSDNRDRVDYGMRLDGMCRPVGEDAVFPYWRNLEHTPVTRHALGFLARMAYGVSYQETARTTSSGADHGLRLKQVDRTIWVTTSRAADGRCTALVRSNIGGVENAELLSIYVKLGGPLSVDYVDVKGRDLATGQALFERMKH